MERKDGGWRKLKPGIFRMLNACGWTWCADLHRGFCTGID